MKRRRKGMLIEGYRTEGEMELWMRSGVEGGEWKRAKWIVYERYYEKGGRGRSSCPCFCTELAFAFAVFLEGINWMVSSLKRCVLYEGACCLMSGAIVTLKVCL